MWRELYETIKYRQNSILVGEIIDIINIYYLFKENPDMREGVIEPLGVIYLEDKDRFLQICKVLV